MPACGFVFFGEIRIKTAPKCKTEKVSLFFLLPA